MKVKRPTSSEEVLEYDRAVARELFHMLRQKMRVTLGGVTENELFSVERAKQENKKGRWDNLDKETVAAGIQDIKEGNIPSTLKLPPVIFNSSAAMDSGVPYLEVVAISWLNKDTPKNLPHALLTLMKSGK